MKLLPTLALALSAGWCLALVPVRPAAPPKGIEWAPTFEGAFEAAVEAKRVLFVAVNMDDERANERMVKSVYSDKRVVALSTETVNLIASAAEHKSSGTCPRFGCESCESHRFIDASVRQNILKPDASGAVVAPQHVFLAPDGGVILSVPFEVSADELVWCFHEALARQAAPDAADRARRGRRPRRLIVGGVFDLGSGLAPITRDEALEIIKEHKKGAGRVEGEAMLRRLVTADEPEAREYVLTALRAGGGGGGRGGAGGGGRGGGGGGGNADKQRADLLRWIGTASPQSYWELCAEFADSGAESVQREAVVALEQLSAKDSLPMLMKALRRATDATQEKNIVRAIGATARDDKKAKTALLRASIDKKSPLLRENALIALGWLDASDEVDERLRQAALPAVYGKGAKVVADDVTAKERLAAVVAMGLSRGERWKELLGPLAEDAAEPEPLREAARAALEVIGGAPFTALGPAQKDAGSDEIPRERLFKAALRQRDR